MKHLEGAEHGFMVLRGPDGRMLASGDQIQFLRGKNVVSEMIFRFRDGSLEEETTVYSQHDYFRLVSDHLMQKGPAFPNPIDVFIDAANSRVTTRSVEKGEEKVSTEQVHIPEDIANGILIALLRNLKPGESETTVPYISTTSKPRIVKLAITSPGDDLCVIAGTKRKAIHFVIKVELGGVAGVIAPVIGKQPPDMHVWVLDSPIPAFLRFQGILYEGGPVWNIELAAPIWQQPNATPNKPAREQGK